MTIQMQILDEAATLSFEALCEQTGMSAELVRELVEVGILEPVRSTTPPWDFPVTCLAHALHARRLAYELALDWPAIAVIMPLLAERDAARRRLAALTVAQMSTT
jgi:chaperone modulatory protein CbpM